MDDNTREDRLTVYEIGYLLIPSLSEEDALKEVAKVKNILEEDKASIISEEMPHKRRLAYAIHRKTVGGSYEAYDEAYFGWVKFEVGTNVIESLKKSIKSLPAIVRTLLVTTVRENTYQGKYSTAAIAPAPVLTDESVKARSLEAGSPVEKAVPASIEEMDKSIDDMVKEV